jgi:hypothetical protein
LLLVAVLLLLIRQSYKVLLEVRETYRTTIEVLVEAAEGADPVRRGHAERTSRIARRIAEEMGGLGPADLERIGYAALVHDVAALASSQRQDASAADVLKDVGFFSSIIGILRASEGEGDASINERERLWGFVVALASAIDEAECEVTTTRCTVKAAAVGVAAPLKGKAVGAAVALGYKIPAVS